MTPLTRLKQYESRMHRLSLEDAAQLAKAYKVHAELTHRASVQLHAEHDERERAILMKNIDCVIAPLLCFAIAGVNVILLGPIPSFG
jgi:hypothetical protein